MAKLTTCMLMTILFVSQSFAVSIHDCQQHLDPSRQSSMSKMGLSLPHDTAFGGGNKELTGTILTKHMDCCDEDECSCPVGACHTLGPISLNAYLPSTINADKVFSPLLAITPPFLPCLKRPPIIS